MNVADRPGRLRVGIIGAGRVGTILGAALNRAGHKIIGAAAVSAASINRARTRLPDVEILPADEVVRESELVLVAVPDDVLPGLVAGLSDAQAWQPGQLVAHVSGAYGLDVLAPATRSRALPLALHPVMTFTGRAEDLERVVGISYGVTAPPQLRPVAEALVMEMGGEPVWIAEQHRALYHAALAISANHLVTLIAEGADLLRDAGVANPNTLLAPLVSAALDNGLRLGDAGLTGPIVRGDAATVERHLDALRERAPQAVAPYVALARRTADRALAARQLAATDAEALLDVLGTTTSSPENFSDERTPPPPAALEPAPRSSPTLARTRAQLAAFRERATGPVAVVMTMGALHAGHVALLRQARQRAKTVVATIFVNPLQFGPGEDFQRYPRPLADDLAVCAQEGVDLVFSPSDDEMYPNGATNTLIEPGPLARQWEGEQRPGHFAGVATVVTTLLNLIRPDLAFFGEKDYQQLVIVQQLVADLALDVDVVGVPIVRDADGLALSSRNAFLTAEEREQATAISAALRAGAAAGLAGAAQVLAAANVTLADAGIVPDYCALTDTRLQPAPASGPARLLIAARVGRTRLLDNGAVTLGEPAVTPETTGGGR